MADLPDRANLVGTPTEGTFKTALGQFYDYVLEKCTSLLSHLADGNNPHGTTAAQVGAVPTGDVAETATASKIVRRNSSGQVVGNITGNAATCTTANGVAAGVAAPPAGNASQVFSVANATSANHAVALGQFGGSFASSGYRRYPDGFMEQWGTTTISGRTWVTINLPTPFVHACLHVDVSYFDNEETDYTCSGQPLYASQIALRSNGNNSKSVNWRAIGY